MADALLAGLETLDRWPEKVRLMQKNWIGRSEGARVFFPLIGASEPDAKLEVFTTRPDTLYGASFCAISPGHPLAVELSKTNPDIDAFLKEAALVGTTEAALEKVEKKGVDTGLRVGHPFIKDHTLPVFVANFVLMDYGTGAIFGCPAHDQRDIDFARKYGLPVIPVVAPKDMDATARAEFVSTLSSSSNEAFSGDGVASAKAPSITVCATGVFPASAIGAALFR